MLRHPERGRNFRHNWAQTNGSTSTGPTRERIARNVAWSAPTNESSIGATKAMTILQIRLYVAIVVTLAPNIPPITTAAMATGARTQIMAPCANNGSNHTSDR